jgi:2-dehydro-3-deoxy-D-arabinonate dehydratase
VRSEGTHRALDATLADLLALPVDQARALVEAAQSPADPPTEILAPVDVQEIWAAGVTYQRSREGRREESGHGDIYDLVYAADRPELFFKSTAARVVGHGKPVGIRADSGWDVPEAEVGVVVNSSGEIFGYTIGNDVSSRSIEGDNPLYLPQAKVYTAACALGPAIVPAWLAGTGPFDVKVRDLVAWLYRALDFPHGAVLLTGTGVVPDADFTLHAGDVTTIEITGIGTLSNPTRVVGTA